MAGFRNGMICSQGRHHRSGRRPSERYKLARRSDHAAKHNRKPWVELVKEFENMGWFQGVTDIWRPKHFQNPSHHHSLARHTQIPCILSTTMHTVEGFGPLAPSPTHLTQPAPHQVSDRLYFF